MGRPEAAAADEPSHYLKYILHDLKPWADLGGISKVGACIFFAWWYRDGFCTASLPEGRSKSTRGRMNRALTCAWLAIESMVLRRVRVLYYHRWME